MVKPDCEICPNCDKVSENHDFCLYFCDDLCSRNRDAPAMQILETLLQEYISQFQELPNDVRAWSLTRRIFKIIKKWNYDSINKFITDAKNGVLENAEMDTIALTNLIDNLIELTKNHDRLTNNPEICHGKTTVKGTRVMVFVIIDYLESGDTINEIVEEFPSLKKEDILQIYDFARSQGRCQEVRLED